MNSNIENLSSNKILINHLKFNSFYLSKYKIFYVATPKVACTSIKWWIADLLGITDSILKVNNSAESSVELMIHDTFSKIAPEVTELNLEILFRNIISSDIFRFALVRNPYERIFSAWQSKILLQEPLQTKGYLSNNFLNLPIDSKDDIKIAFEAFLNFISQLKNEDQDIHFIPQFDLLRPDLIDYGSLVKIEDHDSLLNSLKKYLEADFKDPFNNYLNNKSLIPFSQEFISEKSADIIHDLYKKDFEEFNYSENIPINNYILSRDNFSASIISIKLLRSRHKTLAIKNTYIESLHSKVGERDAKVNSLNQEITSLHQSIDERKVEIGVLTKTLGERDAKVNGLNQEITSLHQSIDERKVEIGVLTKTLGERDAKVNGLNQEITSLHQSIDERKVEIGVLTKTLGERDAKVNGLNQEITSLHQSIDERKVEIGALTQTLGERDAKVNSLNQEITSLHQSIDERKVEIGVLTKTLGERDAKVNGLNQEITSLHQSIDERKVEIGVLTKTLGERDAKVNGLNQEITSLHQSIDERKVEIGVLTKTLGERDAKVNGLNQEITSLHQSIDERKVEIGVLTKTLGERDAKVNSLNQEINDVTLKYENILNSLSWRFTKPFRDARLYLVDKPKKYLRSSGHRLIKSIWKKLPISEIQKLKLKNIIFNKSSEVRNIELLRSSNNYVHFKKNDEDLQSKVKLICFYLPQFHEINENNLWWGVGFTEWTNVRAAKPIFEGHYQPRIPDALGYYNLLDEDVQKKQVELAKNYGVGGFCFYFYWFAGRTLLEDPVKNYLKSNNDLPFCLCWANENWTRTWDGLDNQILIAQSHSSEDDLAFIEYISRYFNDSRYTRVNNKPLLLVYRPNLLPSAKETADRWRGWCKNNGIGDIYIAYTQSFESVDPNEYGFDAAVEFPPNNSTPPDLTDKVVAMNKKFKGKAYDISIFEERSRNYSQPSYKLYRSVCPSWDNSARRKNTGGIFLNSTPHKYEQWLKNAIKDTMQYKDNPDERLIFVNAWNEWAEGAYLEPDAHYGYAYLEATKNALLTYNQKTEFRKKIVLVAHDAYPHGAQFLALNIAKTLNESFFCEVSLVCLGDGPLKAEYKKYAHFYDLAGKDPLGDDAHDLANKLYQEGYNYAIVNTAVSGHFLETLHKNKFECISLIHEMGGVLKQYNLSEQAKKISKFASKIIFASKEVADSYCKFSVTDQKKFIIRPQGLYKRDSEPLNKKADHLALCKILNLKSTAKIILGVGYADYRKGADLFIDIGVELIQIDKNAYMVWVGNIESSMQEQISAKLLKTPKLKNHFIFTGLQENTNPYYRGADIFALTSREDPFPSVVLEAMNVGLPVVAFNGSGGINKILEKNCGLTVPMENVAAFKNSILKIIKNEKLKNTISEACIEVIKRDFSFRHYLFDLLDYLNVGYKKVSVIVPNYNYEQYIDQRLDTIAKQNYPLYEIIFLDDYSIDKSLIKAQNFLNQSNIDFKIHSNIKNSNSVVSQWKKGVDLASGDYIWIAEADDYSAQNFVSEIIKPFDDPKMVLSYCESNQMNEKGAILDSNYLKYVVDVDPDHWTNNFVNNGQNEILNYFYIKNTIPNVSAVIFRADALKKIINIQFSKVLKFSIAHDWFIYYHLLKHGNLSFNSEPYNYHRRHIKSVTKSGSKKLLNEIKQMQDHIRIDQGFGKRHKLKAEAYLKFLMKNFAT